MAKNVKKLSDIKGVTLIALVVTIIVLLILAGVAINLTIGNNGLFARAQNAVNIWKRAEASEKDEMSKFLNTYDEILNSVELNGGKHEDGETIKKPISEITGDEKQNIETTDSNGDRVVIPPGFVVDPENSIVSDGLVIIDKTAGNENTVGNEFVWIPCTIDGENNTLKYDRYAYSKDNWDRIQVKLDEKDEDGSYKIVREDKPLLYYHEPVKESEMASIKKNGGFYIGRYQVGIDVERTSHTDIASPGKIKSGLNVYNYVTMEESKVIAEAMYKGNSELCSSYAWDTTLKFIDGDLGTYAVESTGANYSGILKNTGNHSMKNIYDMAGNVYEWTSEICSGDTDFYASRGGSFINDASLNPVADRSYSDPNHFDEAMGFRVTMYI